MAAFPARGDVERRIRRRCADGSSDVHRTLRRHVEKLRPIRRVDEDVPGEEPAELGVSTHVHGRLEDTVDLLDVVALVSSVVRAWRRDVVTPSTG